MKTVFATTTASVTTPGGSQVLVRTGTHWLDDDPVVREHPELFSDDPRYGVSYSVRPASFDEPPVEQVTAGPGEQRGRVRRG